MPKTVLTLDDSATIRKMVSFTLGRAGYEVIEAADGQAALATLRSRRVDLVITDLNMPGMDGVAFTREARLLPAHTKTPIILLTTNSDIESKNAGRAAGATGWILKPFNGDQLLGVAAKILGGP